MFEVLERVELAAAAAADGDGAMMKVVDGLLIVALVPVVLVTGAAFALYAVFWRVTGRDPLRLIEE